MRLTFLGTGTSSGIPSIGCTCPVCTSDDPCNHRLRTSACLEFVDPDGSLRAILLDAGPDLRQQALRHNMVRLDAILFTHHHVDHTFGLDEVRRFNVLMNQPIDIYADAHTTDALHRVYQHIFRQETNAQKSFVASLISHIIEPFEVFGLYGLTITPLTLMHGRVPILGYRFDAPWLKTTPDSILPLAYCTDVSTIPPATWPKLTGLNTLVLDALRRRHHPTHMTLDRAVEVADRIGAKQTYFVHMSHDLDHETTNARLPCSMRLAHDGLTLGPSA